MTVLVTAASKHGATREIAKEIARVLDEHGVSTELLDIDDVTDLSSYEAYVVGSGIYLGNWLKNARRFLDTHAAELTQHPTWLFASGSIVGEPPVADDPDALRPGLVERLVETTHAREHKLFAGKLDTSKLGLLERAAMRGAHASEGDHRDWDEIDRWAEEIAGRLKAQTEKTRVPTRDAARTPKAASADQAVTRLDQEGCLRADASEGRAGGTNSAIKA